MKTADIALVALIAAAVSAVAMLLRWLTGQPTLEQVHVALSWHAPNLETYRGKARVFGRPPMACLKSDQVTILYWRLEHPGLEGMEVLACTTQYKAGPLLLGYREGAYMRWHDDGPLARHFTPSLEDRERLDDILATIRKLLPPTLA